MLGLLNDFEEAEYEMLEQEIDEAKKNCSIEFEWSRVQDQDHAVHKTYWEDTNHELLDSTRSSDKDSLERQSESKGEIRVPLGCITNLK